MKVNLLPRKEFEIVLDNVRLYGKFGTWMVNRYCQLKGMPIEKALIADDNAEIPLTQRLDDAALMLLCAVEYSFRLKKLPFEYDLVDAYDWIDQMGGVMGGDYLAVMAHAGSDNNSQKKSEGSQPASASSSNGSMEQGEV